MNITQFLHNLNDVSFFDKNPVIYFGSDIPIPLFIATLKRIMKKKGCAVINIDSISENQATLYARLSMSCLGERTFFWLDGIDELDALQKKKMQAYLTSYEGPNIILSFVPQLAHKKSGFLMVDVPAFVKKNEFIELFDCMYEKKTNSLLIERVFEQYNQLPLDTACLIMEYVLLISRQQAEIFVEQWLPLLIEQNYSLFTLSTHFFSKNKDKFFHLWSSLSENYGEPFWITFWSEQLFQAYNFIAYAQQNKFVEAKKFSNRLPFTFSQKDWKQYSLTSLQNAHNFIYSLDWSLKNGTDSYVELFFIKFFLGEFEEKTKA